MKLPAVESPVWLVVLILLIATIIIHGWPA